MCGKLNSGAPSKMVLSQSEPFTVSLVPGEDPHCLHPVPVTDCKELVPFVSTQQLLGLTAMAALLPHHESVKASWEKPSSSPFLSVARGGAHSDDSSTLWGGGSILDNLFTELWVGSPVCIATNQPPCIRWFQVANGQPT